MKDVEKKIRKILAIAEKGTEHEQKVALMKAQKIMLEYHLNEAGLKDQPTESVISLFVDMNTYCKWASKLVELICKNFRCVAVYVPYAGKKGKLRKVRIYGFETDAVLCKSVLEYAHNEIQRLSKKKVNFYYRNYGCTSGVKETYIGGFLYGLQKGFEQQLGSNESYALVVTCPSEVLKITSSFESKVMAFRKTKAAQDSNLYYAGYDDGIDLSTRIQKKGVEGKIDFLLG